MVGQRRREKIVALEAQAKGLTPPKSFTPPHYAAIDFSTGDNSETSPELISDDIGDEGDIRRDSDDIGLPMVDFNQEPTDFQLFQDFGKLSLCKLTSANFSQHP